jgi:hypothetical protein
MQIAFGPIVAAYLVVQGWRAEDIRFALSIGGTASLVSQAPGGELVDSVRAKRLLVAAGVVAVALSVLIPWLCPAFRSSPDGQVVGGPPVRIHRRIQQCRRRDDRVRP